MNIEWTNADALSCEQTTRMRYIDAGALKELIDGGFDISFDEVPETKKALLHMIDYQETADVVEVVRCKDCEHWDEEFEECDCPKVGRRIPVPAGFYCGYGERREG